MKKKILISLSVIGLVAAIAIGGTIAYFNDTETSVGNIFTAGVIDLKIDNESYYNGVWQDGTSWELTDLDGELFFNFTDLKPGDWGEDTVSLRVYDNDAWACVSFENMVDYDNGCTEPEAEDGDQSCGNPGPEEGELSSELEFFFWADVCDVGIPGAQFYPAPVAGDNIFQPECDRYLMEGLANNILPGTTYTLAAPGEINVFTGVFDEPLTGSQDYYIGKVWCFGDLDADIGPNGLVWTCDGAPVNNITQTDSLETDIIFYAEQSRNNPNFTCIEREITSIVETGWGCDCAEEWQADGRWGDGGTSGAENEIRIGYPGGDSPIVQAHTDSASGGLWQNGQTEDFTLVYDGATQKVYWTIGTDSINTESVGDLLDSEGNLCITGKTNGPDGDDGIVTISEVKLDGISPTGPDNFVAQGIDPSPRGLVTMIISGDTQLSDGFTLTGKVRFDWGASPDQEGPSILIRVQDND